MNFHLKSLLNRATFRLFPLAALAIVRQAAAEPGDFHEAYSSFDGTHYDTSAFVAEKISGTATPFGVLAAAYRFTAEYSGPLELIQVALYGQPGYEGSAKVVLFTDTGGRLGVPLGEWEITGVLPNAFKGYTPYNNFRELDPSEPTIILQKGLAYWVSMEPLTTQSYVKWANNSIDLKTRRYRLDVNQGTETYGTSFVSAFTVRVFEPNLPEIISPSVPLVEGANVPDETPVAKLGSLGNVPQAPCRGLLDIARTPVILGADGKVKLRAGAPVALLGGAVITKLDEPSGDIVLATLKRQTTAPVITAANDVVLIGGVQNPPLRIVARTGEAIAGGNGAVIKKFISLDGSGTSPFFSVQLAGTGVTGKNDTALAAAAGSAPAHILVRDDDAVGAAKVTIIGTLVGASDSIGEGRWRASDGTLGVRLTLSDKSNHLFSIPATATMQSEWTAWAATGTVLGAPISGAVIKSIGIPGFGPDGVVFPATLTVGTGGVAAGNDNVLLQQTAAGIAVLAREGDAAPAHTGDALEDGKFKTFGNPVYGPSGRIAFNATLAAKANPAGIWWLDGAAPLRLIARVGDPAPPLGKFAKFTNLILPNAAGSVPIFEAKLATQPAAAVSAATSDGIWALNNAGRVTLVARNGNYAVIRGAYSTIASMIALAAPASSSGAAHGVDADGSVRVTAVLTGFGTTIKKRTQFAVPIPQP